MIRIRKRKVILFAILIVFGLVMLKNTVAAETKEQAKEKFIFYGNYEQDNEDSNGKEPIKWKILEEDTNSLFLVSKQNLEVGSYQAQLKEGITWRDSDMRAYLNGLGKYDSDNFIKAAFSNQEQKAFLEKELKTYKSHTLCNQENHIEANLQNGASTIDKVFLLSKEEVKNINYHFDESSYETTTRISTNTAYVSANDYRSPTNEADFWWLRSPAQKDGFISVVDEKGNIVSGVMGFMANFTAGIRPALFLDQKQIAFVTLAKGGKGLNDFSSQLINLKEKENQTENEYKLTLQSQEGNLKVLNTAIEKNAGETLSISYQQATTGADQYLSCLLKNEKGEVLYYGRLKSIPDESFANGEAQLVLPNELLEGNYKLEVFSENYNSDYQTDYIEKPVLLSLKIKRETNISDSTTSTSPKEDITLEETKDGTIKKTTVRTTQTEKIEKIETIVETTDKEGKQIQQIEKIELTDKQTKDKILLETQKNGKGKILSSVMKVQLSQVKIEKETIILDFPTKLFNQIEKAEKPITVSIDLPQEQLIEQIKEKKIEKVTMQLNLFAVFSNQEQYKLEQIILPKTVIQQGKENQKDITFIIAPEKDDFYSWTFDNRFLEKSKRSITDVNLQIRTSSFLNQPLQEGAFIHFEHNGLLPATAKVKLTIDKLLPLKDYAYLYYLDEANNKLVKLPYNKYKIKQDKTIEIFITHSSDYVIVPKKAEKSITQNLFEQIKVTPSKVKLNAQKTEKLQVALPVTLKKVTDFGKEGKDPAVAEVKYTYRSANKKIAAVNQKGKITAKKKGKTVIKTVMHLANGKKKVYQTEVIVKKGAKR